MNTWKKAFACVALLAVAVCCLLLVPVEVGAQSIDSGTCGANVTWTLDDGGTLTVSGTGDMRTFYDSSKTPWSSHRNEIKKVVIEEGVTSIGDRAFSYCDNLTEVVISDSVTIIGQVAFSYNESLRCVTIGKGVTSIGTSAFKGCTSLNEVYITDASAWLNIEFCCFYSNPMNLAKWLHIVDEDGQNVTQIVLDNSVTAIPDFAFRYCYGLKRIIIPESVTSIGKYPFPWLGYTHILYTGSEEMWNRISKTSSDLPENEKIQFQYVSGTNYHIYDDEKDNDCNVCYQLRLTACVGNPLSIEITTEKDYPFTATGEGAEFVQMVYTGQSSSGDKKGYDLTFRKAGTFELVLVQETTGATVSFTAEITDHAWKYYDTIGASCKEGGYDRYICDHCQKEEKRNSTPLADHKWNAGQVTKGATCKEEGVKTYTCVVCSITKTEPIAKSTSHTYDGVCDSECNVCGGTRTVAHQYADQWSKDGNSHWHICTICLERVAQADHIPGPAATETEDQVCTVCGYVLASALEPTYTSGDVDGNDMVTDADAVYLLYYTFLPQVYPVSQDCDFDGDGQVTDADAVYLLYYTFLPDVYPIHRWTGATCLDAPVCTKCGATKGAPLGHKWQEATCITPKTCERCALTEGEASGHRWVGQVTKEPTATAEGERTYTCKTCRQSYTESIPKTSFNPDELGNPHRVISSVNPRNYIELSIHADTLQVCGEIDKEGLQKLLIICGEERKVISAGPGDYFYGELSLKGLTEQTDVKVYTKINKDNSFWSYFYLPIAPEGDGYVFTTTSVVEHNGAMMAYWVDPQDCLNGTVSERMQELSDSIVAGETDPYKKMYLLEKWVAENIYYDYDYYDGRSDELFYDAESVLTHKRTVCGGYANLLYELLQAQGIPCLVTTTYSTGTLTPITPNDAQIQDANHAQVQAYLERENRWVILDATWDSGNKYKNGVFTQGDYSGLCFDMTLDLFSRYHKIITRTP